MKIKTYGKYLQFKHTTFAFSSVNKPGQTVEFVFVFDQICKVPFPVKTGKTPDSTGSLGVPFNPTEAKTEIF